VADAEEVAELRRLIDEPDDTAYTDTVLSDRLDAASEGILGLARDIWREKAARFAGLIDIQEGMSSRKMSQLYGQALKMADSFSSQVLELVPVPRFSRTRKIERG
jgi:hypothetical protein